MIQQLKKGGLNALIVGLGLILATKFFWYFGSNPVSDYQIDFAGIGISIGLIPLKILVALFIIVQAYWLNELIRRERIFERENQLVFWFFLLSSVGSYTQTFQLEPVLFQCVLLYAISRCLQLNDEEMTRQNIYLDIGSVFGFGLLFFPSGIFYLPVVLIMLNSFARFDINRLLLLLLGATMIFLLGNSLIYVFFDTDVYQSLANRFKLNRNFLSDLNYNFALKGILIWLFSMLAMAFLLIQELGRSPVRQRKMIRVFWMIVLFGLPLIIFEGGIDYFAPLLVVPISMSWSFIGNRSKRLLWPNLVLLGVVWALFVLQWAHF